MATFKGFSQATIDFMWNLRLNNNKPWFEEHKQEFIDVFQNPMKALGREVFERIEADFDGRGFTHEGQLGDELFTASLADRIVKGHAFLMPYYDYFITLDSDPLPTRR